jgi:hypothetical protein
MAPLIAYCSFVWYAVIMTIQQTIEIPSDCRVHIDLLVPREIPLGVAEVAITFNGAAMPKTAAVDAYLEHTGNELEEFEKEAVAKTAKRLTERRRPFEGLRGSLQNSGVFAGDPVEIIRKIRDEW